MSDLERGAQGPSFAGPDAAVPLLSPALPDAQNVEHWTRSAARKAYSTVSHLGLSVLFGTLSAIALKTVGKSIAVTLVVVFVAIQVLAYYGFVQFNWQSLGRSLTQKLRADLGLDAERQLELQHVGNACTRLGRWCLGWGLPSLLAFSAGFWLGWCVL